ncbi:polysaccharide deacetylase family protein [Acrocarpospora catenulata]|uniref:polysaccharide deacetylase family protein n=1 Tax=Acrocarpospora catenulata TaxID=2836182 RepID=UPI001BDA0BC5|nr:polysaccharide deacetylase family protein [Acrocarpospora catenulata]
MRIALLVSGALVLTGCAALTGSKHDGKQEAKAAAKQAAKPVNAAAAAAKVKANELGQVPVLMYHRIVEKPTTQDDRTPADFRAELERLAREDYVPVTAAEYVTGKIDIPAGKHPVVLTFDDSSPSQLTLDGAGTPKADTAVAILREVAAKHPGFRPVATFYVTRDMFGEPRPNIQAQLVSWLRQNGFDLGNHTKDHHSLGGKSQEAVASDVVDGHELITKLNGGTPVTIALPYGIQPRQKEWALKGKKGSVSYDYGGEFLAGYTPAPSPFSKEFDPTSIPRIRSGDKKGDCSQFCSSAWLDRLKEMPGERYTSDGNPKTVAMPKFQQTMLAAKFASRALGY